MICFTTGRENRKAAMPPFFADSDLQAAAASQ
jgi:hypothetical protein